MNSKKLYFIFVASIGLLIVAIIGGAYATNNLLQQKSETLVAVKAASDSLDAQQAQLTKNKKDIVTYKDLNDIAKHIVPQDKDQAEAVLEIVRIAQESNIQPRLSSITFPVSTLGAKPVTGTTGTTSVTPTANNNLSQLTPVKGVPGVYDLQITLQQSEKEPVSYPVLLTFLKKLEQNRRTAQVNSITITPDTKNPALISFTLIIDEYIKP